MDGAPRPVVHLVDSHVYVFRAYYGMPPMTAPDGAPVGAAHGFASTLLRLLGELAPTHLGCVFDFAMTSFRNALFPAYKAGRTEAPADLEPQFALCEDVARALGLPVLTAPDFEADDVIATVADAALAAGADVVVVTTDKDLAQLVREDGRVVLFDLAKQQRLDADGVRRRFGVSPAQIPDYLALVGDAVDNLPGVPGIGPKTAAQLLAGFGALTAIPDDAAAWRALAIRGADAAVARFAAHREQALRIRALATVRRDAPGAARDLDALAWHGPDAAVSAALFARLDWKGIARRATALGASRSA
jgi:5'-3' exonuclease